MSQEKNHWDEWTRQLEEEIRAGHTHQVRKALMAPNINKAPRSYIIRLSNLARRVQFPALSLRLLRPYVHPVVKSRGEATPEERLEYAYALQRIGAKSESVRILEKLTRQNDRAYLAFAFHFMSDWDQSSALFCLENFLASSQIQPYERSVGEVNRLACLVSLEDERAEDLFTQLRKDLRAQNFSLLAANILEIMAQYWIRAGDFTQARGLLSEAKGVAHDIGGIYSLFIDKWSVIADALEARNPDGLERLRARALAASHWETLRDLDYFRSVLNPHDRWSSWVYFGTPYVGFRDKLEKLRSFPETAWVCRQPQGSKFWDPWFANSAEAEISHRFVAFLARDFYRPARVGEIFSALFPDQHFDIDASPDRVYQIVRRARQWVQEEGLPLRIDEYAGSYRLHRASELALLGRKNFVRFTKTEFVFDRFHHSQTQSLRLEEWAERLKCGPKKAKNLLQDAKAAGLIQVERRGPHSRYMLRASSYNDEAA